jgi:hypothetical protein
LVDRIFIPALIAAVIDRREQCISFRLENAFELLDRYIDRVIARNANEPAIFLGGHG